MGGVHKHIKAGQDYGQNKKPSHDELQSSARMQVNAQVKSEKTRWDEWKGEELGALGAALKGKAQKKADAVQNDYKIKQLPNATDRMQNTIEAKALCKQIASQLNEIRVEVYKLEPVEDIKRTRARVSICTLGADSPVEARADTGADAQRANLRKGLAQKLPAASYSRGVYKTGDVRPLSRPTTSTSKSCTTQVLEDIKRTRARVSTLDADSLVEARADTGADAQRANLRKGLAQKLPAASYSRGVYKTGDARPRSRPTSKSYTTQRKSGPSLGALADICDQRN